MDGASLDHRADPGSFRDRHSRVVDLDGRILRLLDRGASAEWDALATSGFFGRAVAAGAIVGTRRAADFTELREPWVGALEH